MDVIISVCNTLALGLVTLLFVWGLVVAPWPVLLVLLLAVLIWSRRMMDQIHPVISAQGEADVSPDLPSDRAAVPTSNAKSSSDDRTLFFRGAPYRPSEECPPHSVTDPMPQQVNLLFRGASYHCDPAQPQSDQSVSGKYRGSSWRSSSQKNSEK